jgi:hypothetical protein
VGHYKQVLHEKSRPDLVFVVGLLSIRDTANADGTRYALVELEGRWEELDEDRVTLPADLFK